MQIILHINSEINLVVWRQSNFYMSEKILPWTSQVHQCSGFEQPSLWGVGRNSSWTAGIPGVCDRYSMEHVRPIAPWPASAGKAASHK